MFLENEERLRFAAYCQQQSDDCKRLADQIDEIGDNSVMLILKKRQLTKAAAYGIVAVDLMMAETETVG
jgi:hypothetical protein